MEQLELPFPKIARGPIPLKARLKIVERMQELRQQIADAAKELDMLQWMLQANQ